MAANSMAATLAAAGLNLHVNTVSNTRETSLINATNATSPNGITAATLLAAAAAHAAATVVSTRRQSLDERNKEDNEKHDHQHQNQDRHMDVNVDEDDDTGTTTNAGKDPGENMSVSKRENSSHNINKTSQYEENIAGSDDNNSQELDCPESGSTSPSLSNSTDKHRRKTRKQDVIRDKY
jgi:hypothetical protein